MTCLPFLDICADNIYVIAFTTHAQHASTVNFPFIRLTLTNGAFRDLRLFDAPGAEFQHGVGDMWQLPISDFGFSGSTCVTYDSISQVTIREGGNDGWQIDSIMTVLDTDGVYQALTLNFRVNRWVDGDDLSFYRSFDLTKV